MKFRISSLLMVGVLVCFSVSAHQTKLSDIAKSDPTSKQLIIVDAKLKGLSQHLLALPEYMEIRYISKPEDLSDITYKNTYSEIHLLTHGSSGRLVIGFQALSFDNPNKASRQFAENLKRLLSEDSRLWVYACDFAAGQQGSDAISLLSQLTQSRVQASNDTTGHRDYSGNWIFETGNAPITDNELLAKSSIQQWEGQLQVDFDWDVAVWDINDTNVNFGISTVNMNVTVNNAGTGLGISNPAEVAIYDTSGGNGDGSSLRFVSFGNQSVSTVLTFSQAVENLQFSLYDIDNSEMVTVIGNSGINPVLTAENPGGATFSISGNTATAIAANSGVNSNTGTLNVGFAVPVTSVTITSAATGIPGDLTDTAISDITLTPPSTPVAACPSALNRLDWDVVTYPGGSITPPTFSVSDVAPFPDVDFDFTYTGNTGDFTGGAPLESTAFTGAGGIGGGGSALQLLHDPNPDGGPNSLTLSIGFSDTLQDVRFAIMDMDSFVNSVDFRDQVIVRGFDGTTEIAPVFEALSTGSTIGFSGNTLLGHNYDDASDNSPRSTANVYFTQAIDRIELEYSDAANIGGDRTIFLTDFLFCPPSSLPVSLSYVQGRASKAGLDLTWETASETNQAGFEILIPRGEDWVLAENGSVPSAKSLSTRPQHYQRSISDGTSIQQFKLISVDTFGQKQAYGPFSVGIQYGEKTTDPVIDWSAVEQDMLFAMSQNGWKRQANGTFSKAAASAKNLSEQLAHIDVSHAGIQRVSYEALASVGLDLQGVSTNAIAVELRGEAVPRHVLTIDQSDVFGPGAYIDFIGNTPTGMDALYLNALSYQISVNPQQVLPAIRNAGVAQGPQQTHYLYTLKVENQRVYDFSMPGEEPWYDQRLLAFGAPASTSINIPSDPAMLSQGSASLDLNLIGVTNFRDEQGLGPDHHVQVFLNQDDSPIIDARNDGLLEWDLKQNIPLQQLAGQSNQLHIRLPADTGYPFDLIYLDAYQLKYPRAFVALEDQIDFEGETNHFQITGFNSDDLVAYAMDNGRLVTLQTQAVNKRSGLQSISIPGVAVDGDRLFNSGFEINTNATGNSPARSAHYWVSSVDQLAQPAVRSGVRSKLLINGPSDFLIIAHPSFMGQALDAYAAQKSAAGIRTSVIDVNDIYESYSFGMVLPSAIQAFLQDAAITSGYEHVLLVGGDSYDYRNFTGQNSISFIPTVYANTFGIINFTPSDGLLVDFNFDNIPDKSIGRWPVRTPAELEAIMNKSFDFELRWLDNQQSALLVAAQAESGFVFSNQTERLAELATQNNHTVAPENLDRLYLDAIAGQQPPPSDLIAVAQQQLIESINQGRTMTIFSGHGSPTMWTFQGLLTPSVASALDNEGQPSLFSPLTCYTTYWVDPGTNTLAHQLMNNGPNGAAAIHGAAALSRYSENEQMAEKVIRFMLQDGDPLGTAILRAKRELGQSGRFNDVLINWALLGDPTLRLKQ